MRRKQVKIVGNCQASALGNFYRDFVGAPNGEDVVFIDDLGMDTPALQAAVADADMLIVQERDFKHGLTREELGRDIEIHRFPLIMAGFLWPFANEPHVHNVSERPISDGPYPSQMSDSYLNRLIKKGVPPEEALEQYLALDIAKAASLDRMREIYLDRQRERDAACDFDIASMIEANFQDEKLFLTAEHPEGRLFGRVARQLFEAMNVPGEVIRTALSTLFRSPFPPTELPLHPGVIRHFGLSFADDNTRYTFTDEGRFTFAEYVLRYMRFDHNEELRHAMYFAGREDPGATAGRLERALPHSPRSASGYRLWGEMLDRTGQHDRSEAAYKQAIELDPASPDAYVGLAHTYLHAGRFEEGEAMAQKALAIAPTFAHAHLALAETRIYGGKVAEALGPARAAMRLIPGRAQTYRLLGIAFAMAGAHEEAERYARRGMALEPAVADHRNLVAEAMEQGRRREAIALLEEGLEIGVANDQTYSLLGNFWQREGELERADEAFSRGAELYGQWRGDLIACRDQVRELRRIEAERG